MEAFRHSMGKGGRVWSMPWASLVLLLLSACQEETPTVDFSERLVVEGWVRSDQGPYEADIHMLIPYPEGESQRIANIASVHVEDKDGNLYPYQRAGMGEERYLSAGDWQARTGHAYRIVVKRTDARGQSIDYVSSYDSLSSAPRIEDPRLEYRERHDDPRLRVHALSMFFQDPPQVQNFYRWRIRVNGQLREDIQGTVLLSDLVFEGDRKEHNLLIPSLEEGDRLSIELWSVSEDAYRFLLAVALQSAAEEGVPLVSVVGNIRASNGDKALGFFGAAGFSEIEMFVLSL